MFSFNKRRPKRYYQKVINQELEILIHYLNLNNMTKNNKVTIQFLKQSGEEGVRKTPIFEITESIDIIKT